MISDGKFDELECCLSEDKHFLNDPIGLPCGDSACKTCLNTYSTIIRCRTCKKEIDQETKKYDVSILAKAMIQKNLNELIRVIANQFDRSSKKLNGNQRFRKFQEFHLKKRCFRI